MGGGVSIYIYIYIYAEYRCIYIYIYIYICIHIKAILQAFFPFGLVDLVVQCRMCL